jgi:hypothetical protein
VMPKDLYASSRPQKHQGNFPLDLSRPSISQAAKELGVHLLLGGAAVHSCEKSHKCPHHRGRGGWSITGGCPISREIQLRHISRRDVGHAPTKKAATDLDPLVTRHRYTTSSVSVIDVADADQPCGGPAPFFGLRNGSYSSVLPIRHNRPEAINRSP